MIKMKIRLEHTSATKFVVMKVTMMTQKPYACLFEKVSTKIDHQAGA